MTQTLRGLPWQMPSLHIDLLLARLLLALGDLQGKRTLIK